MQMQYQNWNGAHAEQSQRPIETFRSGQLTEQSYTSTPSTKPEELLKTLMLNEDPAEMTEPRRAIFQQDAPSGKLLSTLADFATHLKSMKCRICVEHFFHSGIDVSKLFNDWSIGNIELSSCTKCRTCSTLTCIACTPETNGKLSSTSFLEKRVYWCCSSGRLFLIFILLCGFDQSFCLAKLKETSKSKATHRNQDIDKIKASKKPEAYGRRYGGGDTYPAIFMPRGMGHGSDMAGYRSFDDNIDYQFEIKQKLVSSRQQAETMRRDRMIEIQNARQAEDNLNSLILGLLQDLLPSLERQSHFDRDPSEAVTEMLLESKLLNYCMELLRNDSLDDATQRRGLYQSLLGFLFTISNHPITASRTLFNELPLRSDICNILVSVFHGRSVVSQRYTQSLDKSISNFSRQSSLVLQAAKNNEKDFTTEDGQNLMWICRHVFELSQSLAINSNRNSDLPKIPANALIVSPIIEVPYELITATHAYMEIAKELSISASGRFKRLITDITTLTTSLPSGIFVRYASDRPDIMKAVIIGPQGTPYENGLFEFDFFCPGDYPKSPPLVRYKGTGGGKVTINPNLYADGKVCLSLLGTWPGDPWRPRESTLLQVLISIQAMIFCDEPWFNEPGRESFSRVQTDSIGRHSETYNQKIHGFTVRHAMLDWLDEPPQLWKEVSSEHFRKNCSKILMTVNEWAKKSIPSRSTHHRQFRSPSDESNLGDFNTILEGKPGANDISLLFPRLKKALIELDANPLVVEINPRSRPESSRSEVSQSTTPQISKLQNIVSRSSAEATAIPPYMPPSMQPNPFSVYSLWQELPPSPESQKFKQNAGLEQAFHPRAYPSVGRRRNEGRQLASRGYGQHQTTQELQSGGESNNTARRGQGIGLRSFGGSGLFTGRRRGLVDGVSNELEERGMQRGHGESSLHNSRGIHENRGDYRGRGLLFRGRGGRGRGVSRGTSGNLN